MFFRNLNDKCNKIKKKNYILLLLLSELNMVLVSKFECKTRIYLFVKL